MSSTEDQGIDLGEVVVSFEATCGITWWDHTTASGVRADVILTERALLVDLDGHPTELAMLHHVASFRTVAERSRFGALGERLWIRMLDAHAGKAGIIGMAPRNGRGGLRAGDVPEALLHYVPRAHLLYAEGLSAQSRTYLEGIIAGEHIEAEDLDLRTRQIRVDFSPPTPGE